MEDTYPSSCYPLMHKLVTCLLESDLPSQSIHWFEGDTPN
jgi:hypothetical protein